MRVSRDGSTIDLQVLRNGQQLSLSVKPEVACDYPVVALLDLVPNAWADGSMIAMNSGMMRFFDDDSALQIIIGHELAHNTKNHIEKGIIGVAAGLVLDVALNTDGEFATSVPASYSADLEAEADYVGLYAAALSGIDVSQAEQVWRELGAESSGEKKQGLLDSHPPSPNRFVALRASISRIKHHRKV